MPHRVKFAETGQKCDEIPAPGPRGARARLASLDAIEKAVASGDVKRALKDLALLRERVDGCGTQADTDDWLVDCVSQVRVRELLDLVAVNLGR